MVLLSSVKNTAGQSLAKNVQFTFYVNAQKVYQIPYAQNMEVKNTSATYKSVKVAQETDFVTYDENSKVSSSGVGETGSITIPSKGTAILSFTTAVEKELPLGEGLVVTPTNEQSFIKTQQLGGGTSSWTTTASEATYLYIKEGIFDYAVYRDSVFDDFNRGVTKEQSLGLYGDRKIVVTSQPDQVVYIYEAARHSAYEELQTLALSTAVVEPENSLAIKNTGSGLKQARLEGRTVYDYTKYPNPSANNYGYLVNSRYEQDLIQVWEDGDTQFTNRGTGPITVFAPAESIQLSPSAEPAFRELTLQKGESLHANYDVSDLTKDYMLLQVNGTGTIDFVEYSQDHALNVDRDLRIDGWKVFGVSYGTSHRGTAVTNKGDSDLVFYLPYRLTTLEKNSFTRLPYAYA